MANQHITQLVDDLVSKGRIQSSMKDQYINLLTASPELTDEFTGMLLRGADYTNKTKQLADERRQAESILQSEKQKLLDDRRKLESWESSAKTDLNEYNRLIKDLPDMTAKLAAYEQTLRDYQILDQVSVPASTSPKPPMYNQNYQAPQAPPTSQTPLNFLSRDDAAGALRDFAILNNKMNRIQAKHQRLFGEPLEDDLVTHFLQTGEDPEKHWEVKYNVETKQQEIATRTREAEMAKMKETMRAELMQEFSVDPSKVMGGPLQGKGGVSPLLEAYTQSRALSHSQNHANETVSPPADSFTPPEKRPEIAASRERVAAASNMFMKNFDITGNPTSDEGRGLSRRYAPQD